MSAASVYQFQPEDILALKSVSDAQISPDGSRVAYVLTEIDAEKDTYRSSIWMVLTAGGSPVQFTRSNGRDSAPRWSPDGSQLAFVSDRDGSPAQLYLMSTQGGEARRLTSLPNGAGPAVWSPDGTRLAFSARVLKDTPPTDKEARERWNQRPKVISHAQFKTDGAGYTYDAVNHVFVVAATGGEANQITQGINNYLGPAWSPDGKRLAVTRTRDGKADFSVSDIWVMDEDGSNARPILETAGRPSSPSWSPDGQTIACYGTDEQEPGLGEHVLRIWAVRPDGAGRRNLTEAYDRGVNLLSPPLITPGPIWSADSQTMLAGFANNGNTHICRISATTGQVDTVVGGARWAQQASVAADGSRLAFIAADSHHPTDVYTCLADGSQEKRLTEVNVTTMQGWTLPMVERRDFKTPHDGSVEGWVILPTNRTRPVPLLVDIHGGPHSFHGTNFPISSWYRYILASRGWAVLTLNPTGSGSYGKEFARGIRGRWGEYDLPEQLAAVDQLIAEGVADPDRLAVIGYSYGGYMTSWTITHTNRFKAAMVGAPVVNQESFYGTSDIGMWFAPWQLKADLITQRETYRRHSPINYIENVTTPTLIMHGEADDRCPVSQGEELFFGLLALGKVPTEFVRYPGASHLMNLNGRPSHRVDYSRRLVDWVERYTVK